MLCVIANATYETYVIVINNNTLSYIRREFFFISGSR